MTVKQLTDKLLKLPINLQNSRVKVLVDINHPNVGFLNIDTLGVDQLDDNDPEVLIFLKE